MEKTANRPVQAVIFDLDGLLINTETISYALYQDLLRPYGHTFSVEDYAQNYSGKSEPHNMQAIIARFGLPISVAQGTAFVSAQEKMYFARGVPLKTGAKELLVYLKQKGYLIALASSSVRARALEALSQHGIASYFDAMVFGAEVARQALSGYLLQGVRQAACRAGGLPSSGGQRSRHPVRFFRPHPRHLHPRYAAARHSLSGHGPGRFAHTDRRHRLPGAALLLTH